jgi:glycerol-3-phosphate dehydrogenase
MSTPPAWREAARAHLRSDPFDVLVIGGGINGAGIARDAALRGLRVALLERADFASGTSSRSSRLVHGGVRYLEHGFFHLVFESSRERRTLLRIAPHLVRPLEFTWPVYRGARIPRWKLGAGLWLYDVLALFRNVARHRALSIRGVTEREPGLAREGLTGGASYFDAATDDARLTLANVVDAAKAGAVVLNYAGVTRLLLDRERAAGAAVRDTIAGDAFEVRSATVVNATGPWTVSVSRMEDPASHAAVLGTKGVHIAVPAGRVGNRGAVTLLSPTDGRVMFVLPAGALTIIGTTDTATTETPDRVRATRADVQYLLDCANASFPAAKLVTVDVVAAWAGIRPLIASGNAGDPAGASREHEVLVGPRGVIAVTGGKLTTYRAMAAEVVDVVQRRLGMRVSATETARRVLPDVTKEFACTIADVLVRRTKVAFETRDHGMAAAPGVAQTLAAEFGWSGADIARALDEFRSEIDRMFAIEE